MNNPIQYWKNRKAGKRGQGEIVKPEINVVKPPGHMVRSAGGMIMVNRKASRQRTRDTNKDHKPYTAKGVIPNPQKKEKFSLRLDPAMSNKVRHNIRKQRREMIAEDKRKEKANGKSSIQT